MVYKANASRFQNPEFGFGDIHLHWPAKALHEHACTVTDQPDDYQASRALALIDVKSNRCGRNLKNHRHPVLSAAFLEAADTHENWHPR